MSTVQGRRDRRRRHRARGGGRGAEGGRRAPACHLDTTDYDLGADRYLAHRRGAARRGARRAPRPATPSCSGRSAPRSGPPPSPRARSSGGSCSACASSSTSTSTCGRSPACPGPSAPDCDFVVIRENTEGTYAGEGGFLRKGTPYEVATQGSVNTRHGVERCARFAFELRQQAAAPPDPGAQDQRADLRRRPLAADGRRGGRRVSRR